MKNTLSLKELARIIDVSAVRTDVTKDELKNLIQIAKQYQFICAFAMPCYTPWLIKELKDEKNIGVGGVIGFPSGADTTSIKVATAKELITMGCDELDMVVNVGALKSGNKELFMDDIKAIVDVADGRSVKSILEIAYLTDDEIVLGSELAVKSGVTFVKTGTGWANKPTTVDTIKLIKKTIGDSAKIKAAGGVRDLATLSSMIDAGCERFGISVSSTMNIIKELSIER